MNFNNLYLSFISGLVSPFFSVDSFWGNILIGEYGILTMTPVFLIGVLLPLVTGFFFVQHILDESGLILRIARFLNKPFQFIGLNGNAVIPILLGFGCVTVALVSTNILGTKRERLITSILLCIAVPCSAQVAIIFALGFLLDFKYLLLYLFIIILVFILLGYIINKLLPGVICPISLEKKPLTKPNIKKIIKTTAKEGIEFLQETGLTFFIGSIIVSVMDYYDGFMKLREWFAPITVQFLNIPETAANIFVMSIIKRDLGSAAFYQMVSNGSFTQQQILVTLTVLTLFVPCFASQMILFKEQRILTAIFIWFGSFIVAFAAGYLVNYLLTLFSL